MSIRVLVTSGSVDFPVLARKIDTNEREFQKKKQIPVFVTLFRVLDVEKLFAPPNSDPITIVRFTARVFRPRPASFPVGFRPRRFIAEPETTLKLLTPRLLDSPPVSIGTRTNDGSDRRAGLRGPVVCNRAHPTTAVSSVETIFGPISDRRRTIRGGYTRCVTGAPGKNGVYVSGRNGRGTVRGTIIAEE